MDEKRPTYAVDIAGVHRELALFEIKPGLRIAIERHHLSRSGVGCDRGGGSDRCLEQRVSALDG